MIYSRYCAVFLRAILLLLWAEYTVCDNTEAVQSVGKLRSSADVAFTNGDMNEALRIWSQVIALEPKNDNNFYRRFRVYLRLQKYREALSDLNTALNIKPDDSNVLQQRAKLQIKLGNCAEAEADYGRLTKIDPKNVDAKGQKDAYECRMTIKEAETAFDRQQWDRAKNLLIKAIRFAEQSPALLLKKAICNFSMKDYYEAVSDTGKVLKAEADNIFALQIRGQSYYQLGELESAMNHFRKGLKYDPEHDGCKKAYRNVKKIQDNIKKSDAAFQKQDWEAAIKALTSIKDTDSPLLTTRVYLDLSEAYRQLNQITEAISYAKRAIELESHNAEGYKRLGQALVVNSEYDEAIRVLRKADEILQGNQDIQEEIRKAEAALKQSKQKDYYKILGVPRNAKIKVIKKAYRELALQWHPDKHIGEEEKTKAEVQFQLIAEAYEILSDNDLRQKYDRGEEVLPNQGGQQQHQGFDPFGGRGFGGQQFHHFFHHG